MSRYAYKWPELMDKFQVIKEFEEGRYDEIGGWESEVGEYTDKAFLVVFPGTSRKRGGWVPFSQARKAEDGQSIYVANWVQKERGW